MEISSLRKEMFDLNDKILNLQKQRLDLAKKIAKEEGKDLYVVLSKYEVTIKDYIPADSENEADEIGVDNALFYDVEYDSGSIEDIYKLEGE